MTAASITQTTEQIRGTGAYGFLSLKKMMMNAVVSRPASIAKKIHFGRRGAGSRFIGRFAREILLTARRRFLKAKAAARRSGNWIVPSTRAGLCSSHRHEFFTFCEG